MNSKVEIKDMPDTNKNPEVDKSVIAFFFPPFSESDLIALFYPLILVAIEHYNIFFLFFREYIPYLLWQDTRSESIIFLITLPILLLLIITFFLKILHHAVNLKTMTQGEKQLFSFVYYSLLIMLTIYSLDNSLKHQLISWMTYIERAFHYYLLIRSFLLLLIMHGMHKKNMEHLYAQQLTDRQITRLELGATLVLSTLIYVYMRFTSHDIGSTIVLTYIYTTIMIPGYRNIKSWYSRRVSTQM